MSSAATEDIGFADDIRATDQDLEAMMTEPDYVFTTSVQASIILRSNDAWTAVRKLLEEMGLTLNGPKMDTAYRRIQDLAYRQHANGNCLGITRKEVETVMADELRAASRAGGQREAILASLPVEVTVRSGPGCQSLKVAGEGAWRLCEVMFQGSVVGTVYVNLAGNDLLAQKAGKYLFNNRPA